MSALPPKADKQQRCRHVRFVPKPDLCSAAEDARGCSAVFDRPRLRALTAWVKTQGRFTAIKEKTSPAADRQPPPGCPLWDFARITLPTRAGTRVRCPW